MCLVAKAFTLREGLILARSCYCDRILIESDCSPLIDACRNAWTPPDIAVIAEDVVRLKNLFHHCGLLWTSRETNDAAHWVAQAALSGKLTVDWCHKFPLDLNVILAKDMNDF